LGKLTDKSQIPFIFEFRYHKNEIIRLAVVESLSSFKIEALECVESFLNDESDRVVECTISSLAEFGNLKTTEKILRCIIRRPNYIKIKGMDAVLEIIKRSENKNVLNTFYEFFYTLALKANVEEIKEKCINILGEIYKLRENLFLEEFKGKASDEKEILESYISKEKELKDELKRKEEYIASLNKQIIELEKN
ncbi:MAG: HEAT repeat domain-containing protein, partial [Candidatus Micrarchaeia archaeon]